MDQWPKLPDSFCPKVYAYFPEDCQGRYKLNAHVKPVRCDEASIFVDTDIGTHTFIVDDVLEENDSKARPHVPHSLRSEPILLQELVYLTVARPVVEYPPPIHPILYIHCSY